MAFTPDNYTGFDDEREKIIDDVLKIIRDQKDADKNASIHGEVEIYPTQFQELEFGHLVVGPIDFPTKFLKAPTITFGQHGEIIKQDVRVSPDATATGYTPFLVMPYVYAFHFDSGAVDGFFLGLYNITDPLVYPANHTISWMLQGEGSKYGDRSTSEGWTQAYSSKGASFLTDDTTGVDGN